MRDIIILIAICGFIPFIFTRPWFGILAWSILGYLNPHKMGWGFVNHLPLAFVIGGITLVSAVFSKDRKGIAWSPGMVLLLLLAVWFTLTTMNSLVPAEAWQKWQTVMKILLMTFITTMLIYEKKRIWWLLAAIAFSIGFLGVKGGIFTIINGGEYMVWGPKGSFLYGNTDIGLAFNMVLPLLYIFAQDQEKKWVKYCLFLVILLTIVATIFTYSRGALLGLGMISVLIFFTIKRKFLTASIVVPILIASLFAFAPAKLFERAETIKTYEEDASAMQRIQAWGVNWNLASSRLTGVGFLSEKLPNDIWLSYANFLGEWRNYARSAHSVYFQMLGDHGFIGLAIFIFILLYTIFGFWYLYRKTQNDPEKKWIGSFSIGLMIGLFGYGVSGAFLNVAYFDMFYAYVALHAILRREFLSDVNISEKTNASTV